MKYIGQFLGYILLGCNAIIALLLLFSAYSPYLNPQATPIGACAGLFFPVFLIANLVFLLFWLVVYRRYALFPIAVLLLCWSSIRTYIPINGSGKEAPEDAIKVLSYNTRAFSEMKPHTQEKPNAVLAYLQNSDADIICIQEYIFGGKLKKKDIDHALREYPYRHYYDLGKGWNGLGCYSRYPILSATPIDYESKLNGSIIYHIKVKNDTLVVINNHLESNKLAESDVETYQDMVHDPNRQKVSSGLRKLMKKLSDATVIRARQTDKLRKELQQLEGKRIILCGDLNDTPISYTHHQLCRELEDAFVESGNGMGVSYNKNLFYFRIDHILFSRNLTVYQCKVDDTIKASDHYPISCHVSLE